jgi:hypothetical protein
MWHERVVKRWRALEARATMVPDVFRVVQVSFFRFLEMQRFGHESRTVLTLVEKR